MELLKKLTIEELIEEIEELKRLHGTACEIRQEIADLQTLLDQMKMVKKSIDQVVNSNESLQNRIRVKAEEVLLLTKEINVRRRNEAILKQQSEKQAARIEVLESKLIDIGLIAYSSLRDQGDIKQNKTKELAQLNQSNEMKQIKE